MEPRSAERGNKRIAVPYLLRRHASMEPRSAERGNLLPFRSMKGPRVASMEPRSAERGNRTLGATYGLQSNSFNGATLSRTWKPYL